ncbi:hypothetical protein [Streptomyces sp. NPDC006368]|uniref:hypothetical protein n=1 Tax=Streptomyces sp. NPDC006368 TaxID=3156760 RepID=UPI0033A160B1
MSRLRVVGSGVGEDDAAVGGDLAEGGEGPFDVGGDLGVVADLHRRHGAVDRGPVDRLLGVPEHVHHERRAVERDGVDDELRADEPFLDEESGDDLAGEVGPPKSRSQAARTSSRVEQKYTPSVAKDFTGFTTNSASPLRVQPACDRPRVWEPSREHGFHALRHFYASEQLEAGESVISLAQWLGHTDPGFTPRKYGHFLPRAGSRGSGAIDAVFG